MTKIQLIAISTLFSLLSTSVSYSQEHFVHGYIVDLENDTVNGFIDYRGWSVNPESIVFKTEPGNRVIRYGPSDIRGFGINNDRYISGIVEVDVSPYLKKDLDYSANPENIIDTVFLQILITGPKCLFYLKDENHKQHFYIGNGEIFEPLVYKEYIKQDEDADRINANEKFKGQLILYLNDCPSIQIKIQDMPYVKNNLIGLFNDYYRCTQEKVSYELGKEKGRFEFGLLGGLSLTRIQFRGDESFNTITDADYPWSADFNFGVSWNIVFPRNLGRWSFSNELMYTSFKVSGEVFERDITIDDIYTTTQTTIGYSYIKLNSLFRYKHPFKGAFLFVNGGVSNGFAFAETNYKRVEKQVYSVNSIYETIALEYTRRYDPALALGLGLVVHKFSFEFRAERSRGMSAYQGLVSPVTRYFLILGYRI